MKENEIKTIWSVPKYLPYVQPELTEEILLDTEKQLGFKLPKEYIELLKIQNGGGYTFYIEWRYRTALWDRTLFSFDNHYRSV